MITSQLTALLVCSVGIPRPLSEPSRIHQVDHNVNLAQCPARASSICCQRAQRPYGASRAIVVVADVHPGRLRTAPT